MSVRTDYRPSRFSIFRVRLLIRQICRRRGRDLRVSGPLRPAFGYGLSRSARPEIAIPLYEQFKSRLAQDLGSPVQTGEFGADMMVTLTNDGPVTIIIDSKDPE